LVEAEEKASGRVDLAVYWAYVKEAGGLKLLFALALIQVREIGYWGNAIDSLLGTSRVYCLNVKGLPN